MKSRIMKLATAAVITTAALVAIQQSGSWTDKAMPAYTDILGNVQKYNLNVEDHHSG
jgi:hypothetical protein